jgi:predicted nicotinamide N-methyase
VTYRHEPAAPADPPTGFPPPPDEETLGRLLDDHAPLTPVPACPSVSAFGATSLVDVWQAAERVAGCVLPAPFWAFPWPAGIALARVLFDDPDLVRSRSAIDVGAGGGVSCFAAARCAAGRVVACDMDPWALAVVRLGARRQGLRVETVRAELTETAGLLAGHELILCGDLAYDRSRATAERAAIESAVEAGAVAILADAGRTYFDAGGLELLAEYELDVVRDLEGSERKVARVWALR